MNVQPSLAQCFLANQMRMVARSGKMAYEASEYAERCSRHWRGWSLMFFRAHNMGAGHWVQLTLTRLVRSMDPVPISQEAEERWLRAFFGDDRPMVRTDLATSDFGRRMGTRHYRLFTDSDYKNPRIPQKEVSVEPDPDDRTLSELCTTTGDSDSCSGSGD